MIPAPERFRQQCAEAVRALELVIGSLAELDHGHAVATNGGAYVNSRS